MRNINSMLRILFAITFLLAFVSVEASTYGHLLDKNTSCKVWWAGNTNKIMRNDPVPVSKGKIIIQAARNESEGFQLVLHPDADMDNISIIISDLEQKGGGIISSNNIIIRQVEYVNIAKPSGKHHQGGWYPDPLPLYEEPFAAKAGINTPLWITIKIPKTALSGKYKAIIKLKSANWETSVPLELDVWDFELPDTPFMRSAFGLRSSLIKQYHNLDTDEELKQVLDHYFTSFKEYRISPQQFFDQYPIRKTISGVSWNGGTFDPDTVFAGKYSYQITDNRVNANVSGTSTNLIRINPNKAYMLNWWSKTHQKQQYFVEVKSYDSGRNPIDWHLQGMICSGTNKWKKDSLFLDPNNPIAIEQLIVSRPMPKNAEFVRIQLFPVIPSISGEQTGTVWMDNISFVEIGTDKNLLPYGDFEQNIDDLELEIDYSEFDVAARKYMDELGFTGFRFKIPELRSGPYVGRKIGWFDGFVNGTEEYKKLMKLYLGGFQNHLEQNGWLGKEYLYWIDEPKHEDYEFVREGMKTIQESAPKLTRFITENNPGPEIMDVTNIGCPVLAKFDPEKSTKWIEKGRQMWSYLMTWPKAPHVNLFIDSDAINMRMWLWMSYRYNLSGILVWSSNIWNAEGCSPPGVLQNIWDDPMSYRGGNGIPFGAAPEYGNGDGMFFYPPNRKPNSDKTKYLRGPVPSMRLEILREGIDDYDYMKLLEECIQDAGSEQETLVKKGQHLLNFGSEVFTNDKIYTKNPEVLMDYRKQMAELLVKFGKYK